MRLLVDLASFIVLLSLSGGRSPTTTGADRPCHEHPGLVGRCFRVHGQMGYSNGSILVKIEDKRTHVIYGVSTARFSRAGYCNLPQFLVDSLDADRLVEADFTLCPFTKLKAEPIQLVCVDAATRLRTSAAHFLTR